MSSTCVVVGDALLDPATGEVMAPAAVVIDGGRVTAAGRRGAVSFPRDAEVVDGAGLTLLPGLIDTHVHLSMRGDGINMQELIMTHPSLAVLAAVPACAATLNAGFTTVRDAGYTPVGVKQAVTGLVFLAAGLPGGRRRPCDPAGPIPLQVISRR